MRSLNSLLCNACLILLIACQPQPAQAQDTPFVIRTDWSTLPLESELDEQEAEAERLPPSPGEPRRPEPVEPVTTAPVVIGPMDMKTVAVDLPGRSPMVAVGRNFIIASQDRHLAFLDRQGQPLPQTTTAATLMPTQNIFAAFLERDGPWDINRHSGFEKPCDAEEYPATSGERYCIGQVEDTRVYYDFLASRFIIVAQLRNQLDTEIWNEARPRHYSRRFGVCGVYRDPDGNTVKLPDAAHCSLARRHLAIAVSKTEDPRQGFKIYAVTENNYRDGPWAAVNPRAQSLVIGASGVQMGKLGSALTVFHLEDLRLGSIKPRYYTVRPDELGGPGRNLATRSVAPIVLQGDSESLEDWSLAAVFDRGEKGEVCLRVITLGRPAGQGVTPPLGEHCRELPWPQDIDAPPWLASAVFREPYLHLTWSTAPRAKPQDGASVYALRLPLYFRDGVARAPGISAATAGYRLLRLDKESVAGAILSDEDPAISVNIRGNALVSFVRLRQAGGGDPAGNRFQVRYVLLKNLDSAAPPGAEIDFSAPDGEYPAKTGIRHSWGVVDPLNDTTFWFAHSYRWPKGALPNLLLVRVPD